MQHVLRLVVENLLKSCRCWRNLFSVVDRLSWPRTEEHQVAGGEEDLNRFAEQGQRVHGSRAAY